jgi:hypothetical protein
MRADDLAGMAESQTNTITMTEEMSFSRKVEVFFHELYHLATTRFTTWNGETAATAAGAVMVDFFHNNRKMVQELLEEICKEEKPDA